jgi:alkanesulfonate monooxygenase SsuD/methylene tetrahydromethanopterin reductase-like flavin-dependent oxidoreductase (luciferase family)
LAKTLAAIDRLSRGRLVVAVGPGSSPQDFDSVGVDFAERWARLDESIGALRALWRADAAPFVGRFYSTEGISLDPHPIRPQGPPIWLGSWGSEAGLRRAARLADGWLASAYNTTPTLFAEAWEHLQDLLPSHGKDPQSFPNALATMWFYTTDDDAEADRIMRERVVPTIHRPEEMLRERRRSGQPNGSPRSSRLSPVPVSSECSFGPWPTRRTSSTCSGRPYGRRSPPNTREPGITIAAGRRSRSQPPKDPHRSAVMPRLAPKSGAAHASRRDLSTPILTRTAMPDSGRVATPVLPSFGRRVRCVPARGDEATPRRRATACGSPFPARRYGREGVGRASVEPARVAPMLRRSSRSFHSLTITRPIIAGSVTIAIASPTDKFVPASPPIATGVIR